MTGRHHHHLLPCPPLPPLQDKATTSNSRDYWGDPSRTLGFWAHTRLHGCHISNGFHACPEYCCQSWPDLVPVLGWARSGFAAPALQLANSAQCGSGRNGASIWVGVRHCIWTLPPISYGFGPRANSIRDIHAVRRCCDGYYGMPNPYHHATSTDDRQAFPVLCRILTELKLLQTQVGLVVLSAGVGNDVVGWILLALCVALVNAGAGITALYVLLTCVGYVLFLAYGIRPAFLWVLRKTGSIQNGPTQSVVALTVLMALASAFFTGIIGVHPIFGGFLIGLICPHEGGFAIKVTEKIEDLVTVLFLPLYFALSGLSTNIGLLNNGITWAYVIGVIAVAFVGKVVGGTLAARACKLVWRESFTVGILMSCKGLVELIVLVSALEQGKLPKLLTVVRTLDFKPRSSVNEHSQFLLSWLWSQLLLQRQ